MGQRYEKSKTKVSDNKKALEHLHDDKETLQKEYSPLDALERIQDMMDDDVSDAVTSVRKVGELENQRIDSETEVANEEKKQIADEINSEIAKLNSGLETLRQTNGIEFGKSAVEKSSQEYKKQIDKFKELISELGENIPENSSTGTSGFEGTSGFVTDTLGDSPVPLHEGETVNIPHSQSSTSNLNQQMSSYPKIMQSHSIEDDLVATNPNYSHTDSDSPWNNNCQRCVSAYEARRRGFDVEASPLPQGFDSLPIMRHPNGWPSVYEGAKLIDCSANSGTGAAINIENEMENWGNDARAIVRVRWKPENGGGGHVFIAERNNGITRFIDPQNGQTDAREYFDFAKGSEVFCMRIDNLPFSERIHQCCSSRVK